MSLFGQMEAEWRDQQSGARDQQYDEEQVDECADEGSAAMEGSAIADPGNSVLLKPTEPKESVVVDRAAGDHGVPKQDSEGERGLPAIKSMTAGNVEEDAA